MVNIEALKNKIAEKNYTYQEIAEKTGIDRSTFYRKLKTGDNFLIGEVNKIVEILNLSIEEATSIFLQHQSHK